MSEKQYNLEQTIATLRQADMKFSKENAIPAIFQMYWFFRHCRSSPAAPFCDLCE